MLPDPSSHDLAKSQRAVNQEVGELFSPPNEVTHYTPLITENSQQLLHGVARVLQRGGRAVRHQAEGLRRANIEASPNILEDIDDLADAGDALSALSRMLNDDAARPHILQLIVQAEVALSTTFVPSDNVLPIKKPKI